MTDRQALGELIDELMAEWNVPGVSVGILQGGEFAGWGYGVTSVENPLPVTPETLFQVGSISKTFSAAVAMQLVEEGALELAAPVRAYLPDFKVADEAVSEAVSLQHLLTHTAGWDGDLFLDTGDGPEAFRLYMEKMSGRAQITPPGAYFSYNNSGFYLLGHLLETVTGETVEELFAKRIFTPLGLTMTFTRAKEVISHRFAVGHLEEDGAAVVARPWGFPRVVLPVGGLVSNTPDLLRYAQAYLNKGSTRHEDKFLSAASVEQMTTPQVLIWAGDNYHNGITWFLREVQGVKIVSHGGGVLGQISRLLFIPEKDFALAILANGEHGNQVNKAVIAWLLKNELGVTLPEPELIDSTEDQLAAFAGVYTRPAEDLHLALLGGRLVGQFVGKVGFPTENDPPPAPPPPFTVGRCERDRLLILDGKMKGNTFEVLRREDGSIGWGRFGLRAMDFDGQEKG